MRFQTLDEWLAWQARLHPSVIELGLERVAEVWQRVRSGPLSSIVVTVAGTNGKGSCVAMLDAVLRAAGYSTGCYTSPHLVRYNERIRINGVEASDQRICAAFERVDQARGAVSLTYFEFGTLAALEIFAEERPDVLILEVGLGGRLDAVNTIDADVALITNVELDHADWLGHDREQIGREKAGILRCGRPAVYGAADPPASLLGHAAELGVPLAVAGRDYRFQRQGQGWQWEFGGRQLENLPTPSLPGRCQLWNAAAVLTGLALLSERISIDREAVCTGLRNAHVPGRFQVIPGAVTLVLDVAHNPAAAMALAETLMDNPIEGRTHAVFGILADKDVRAVVRALASQVDRWHVGAVRAERALSTADMVGCLRSEGLGEQAVGYDWLGEAFRGARGEAKPGDRVLVFGSFFAVADVLPWI